MSSPALSPEPSPQRRSPLLTRRTLLLAGLAGAAGAAGGGVLLSRGGDPVGPSSPLVRQAELARATSGRTAEFRLTAAPGEVDLAGRRVSTWLYDGRLPGPELRVRTGDRLRVELRNDLPETTSIHWHGLALRNDMDGVPGLTQQDIAAGGTFTYDFVVPHPGTYFFHPHTGLQLDRGLYAPLVVEDPDDPVVADVEHVLVLDDWVDGTGRTPEDVLAELQRVGMDMGGMDMSDTDAGADTDTDTDTDMDGMDMGGTDMDASGREPLGADTGDVEYPMHLINGRPPEDPVVLEARPGQRVRLRLVNAGGDTAYRFAVGGHRLTVVATDGFPVVPVEVDTLLLSMGERYDVVLTAGSGAFPVVAVAEGKSAAPARAVLRTGVGGTPDPGAVPAETGGRLLRYADLVPADGTGLPPAAPTRTLPLDLGAAASGYVWLINGKPASESAPLEVRGDERVRLVMRNQTMMFHPMHVHGHTFALTQPTGPGTRKDTVIVPPMGTVSVDLQTDNPGQWMVHCHNAYHLEAGMSTKLSYVD